MQELESHLLREMNSRLKQIETRLTSIENKWSAGELAASVIRWLIGLGVGITALVGFFLHVK